MSFISSNSTPTPKFNGIKPEEARLLPYFIFSNINERPSRDILFLIKLEEPYSCLWVNAELWGPASALSLTGPVARQLTSFLVAYICLPLSLLECWEGRTHTLIHKFCWEGGGQVQFQELRFNPLSEENQAGSSNRRDIQGPTTTNQGQEKLSSAGLFLDYR